MAYKSASASQAVLVAHLKTGWVHYISPTPVLPMVERCAVDIVGYTIKVLLSEDGGALVRHGCNVVRAVRWRVAATRLCLVVARRAAAGQEEVGRHRAEAVSFRSEPGLWK